MFVKDYMTRHPIMIEPDKPLFEAQKVMGESSIRHIPVVGDGKRLLGLITRERLQISPTKLTSLNVWEITRYLANLSVDKVMVKGADLHTIGSDATLEDAAELMSQYKVGGLPVVEDDIVVGVITETDLLHEFRNLLGANDPGWRVTMRVPDRTGEFTKLGSAMTNKGWGIMAMGSIRSPKTPDHWDIVLKVRGCTEAELRQVLKGIEDQQIIDVREASLHSS
ncbi:MAG: CBS domain-containing protein [Chloroflexi bacterium]|nr:CBS domain-containing protein [Chloroflexota bacterium]